ncbi:MAG: TrbG/VirB9 family P-type conjugative transfer protein [Sphingomonadales bacterium]|jgi:type IV secretory pathway VirB9-like protein|uniref:TrbG/VirB9 family P-type conjugative transfer protein n=1 Tax=Sphingorhabdus sp. TaxID=1902408 RepID=UPI003BB0512E|nr:TrbG/VirB9 family P-type conjugative transfer protein [Sphingomonadales bacterium]MBK9433233.1 TrbG/VirB9 family P-type conjugative transfer protein [Sphingomonadales bacterium]MBL0022234.1 TrbG/VirB9 family P-type conjugative transfer protein [Sphingomonadales bacterium]
MRCASFSLLLIFAFAAAAPQSAKAQQNDSQKEAFESSEPVQWRYRVTGEKALRPAQMSDDGEKTYLIWDADQALPAVFAVNDIGGEEIVDGYMRDGVFTIDRVYSKLVFRIDRKVAKAVRLLR